MQNDHGRFSILRDHFVWNPSSNLLAMADALNGKEPLKEQKLKTYVEKLLPWNDAIQDRFLAEDPFECKPYTTNSKAVW